MTNYSLMVLFVTSFSVHLLVLFYLNPKRGLRNEVSVAQFFLDIGTPS